MWLNSSLDFLSFMSVYIIYPNKICKQIFEDNKKNLNLFFLKLKGGRFNPKIRGGLSVGALQKNSVWIAARSEPNTGGFLSRARFVAA